LGKTPGSVVDAPGGEVALDVLDVVEDLPGYGKTVQGGRDRALPLALPTGRDRDSGRGDLQAGREIDMEIEFGVGDSLRRALPGGRARSWLATWRRPNRERRSRRKKLHGSGPPHGRPPPPAAVRESPKLSASHLGISSQGKSLI